jgi:hypothetical protein
VPILEQVYERVLVIQEEKPRIERIQFIAHEMMKCHSGVLGRALDQPIERQALIDLALQLLIAHGRPAL